MNRWLIAAPLSVALGYVFTVWQVPAAWILGGIAGAGAVALISGRDLPMNRYVFDFARGAIGVFAAVPLLGVPPRDFLPFLVPGLVTAAAVLALAYAGGLILANHGVSRETGVLSLLPGGASVMPAIAADVGADMRYVALSQYVRLLIVSVTLPLVAALFDAPASTAHATTDGPWWMWLLVPALIAAGNPAGTLLRLPNPSVFGPMLATVLVGSLLDAPVVPPTVLTTAAFLAIGWMCGGALSVPALKQFSRMLPATLAYIAALMAACAAMGWVVAKWLGITFLEGYLATSPGAIETVLALAAEGDAGPAVIALQLIRLICVLIFAGYLPKILKRRGEG